MKRSPSKKRVAGKERASKPVSQPSKQSGKPGSRSTALLPSEWNEFIALLCSHRVRFLLVGAHALAVWGQPRFILNKRASGRAKDLLDLELLGAR